MLVLTVLLTMRLSAGVATRRSVAFRMHLFSNDAINESLMLETRLVDHNALFVIDTGYAGPPVISASYLAIRDNGGASLNERYERIISRLAKGVSADAQHAAVGKFLQDEACRTYTSGCTMKLMGIGSVREQQSDMLLCPSLRFRTAEGTMASPHGRVDADVFVTNPLPQSVHILTCDYLVHMSPAMIDVGRGRLLLRMGAIESASARTRMTMLPFRQSGGAFVVPVELGGEMFDVTVDTGAPGPVSLSADAAARLRNCVHEGKALRQFGVNGEDVCSDIIRTTLKFCGHHVGDVPVFANSSGLEGTDGYMGMGVLRAFNIFIANDGIGFEINGLPLRRTSSYDATASVKSCGVQLQCASAN